MDLNVSMQDSHAGKSRYQYQQHFPRYFLSSYALAFPPLPPIFTLPVPLYGTSDCKLYLNLLQ